MQIAWSEIAEVLPMPGVYAWYYSPQLSKHDVDVAIQKVHESKRNGDRQETSHIIEFLDKHLYRRFAETPYSVRISGALKAEFSGNINHSPSRSDSLLKRLRDQPERLLIVREVLRSCAPDLSCPLYIGMAKNLRQRLTNHQKLIERFRNQERNLQLARDEMPEEEQRDHSFANEIAVRAIPPSQIFVCVKYISAADDANYVDIENILNRIFFPLFGRN